MHGTLLTDCWNYSVDAILYETEAGEGEAGGRLMLKAVSEINLRENMGTLVLHLVGSHAMLPLLVSLGSILTDCLW